MEDRIFTQLKDEATSGDEYNRYPDAEVIDPPDWLIGSEKIYKGKPFSATSLKQIDRVSLNHHGVRL